MTLTKRFFLLGLVALLPFGLDSCKKEETPETQTPVSIQGSWKITKISINPTYLGVEDLVTGLRLLGENCLSDVVVSFKTDGTISYTNPASCQSAANSQRVLQQLFANAKYTETSTTVTLTNATTMQTVATKTGSGNKVDLATQLDINPVGDPVKTTYTVSLTKQ